VRERAATPAKIAETRRRYDADGRLQTVKEKLTSSTWATTTYAYDAANNTTQITDPEGKVTTLEHDFLGHRKRIRRNGRDWDYAYDAAGRLTHDTVPCTPQPTCRAAYTTTYAYDALDRMTTRNLAPRTLSAADRALFGAEKETFVYDTGINNRGRLHQWFSWGPGNVVKQTQSFGHDEHGRQTRNLMSFNTAGYTNVTRSLDRSYLVSGLLQRVAYNDAASGSMTSYADYDYDIRGLPLSVSIVVNGVAQPPVVLTRNVAGLVTKRRTDQPGGTGKFFESSWTYDNLGRVTDQTVNQSTGQVARQALTYVGNDDVSSLTTYFGTTAKGPLNFTYDFRHQLTNVTATGGYYTAAYTYGNAGRLKRTTVSRGVSVPSGDVKQRDYFYNYQGTDPEVVTSLSTGNYAASGGTNAVTYTIDAIGNQIARLGPTSGERIDFVYDGANRLRRATKKLNGAVTASEGARQRGVLVRQRRLARARRQAQRVGRRHRDGLVPRRGRGALRPGRHRREPGLLARLARHADRAHRPHQRHHRQRRAPVPRPRRQHARHGRVPELDQHDLQLRPLRRPPRVDDQRRLDGHGHAQAPFQRQGPGRPHRTLLLRSPLLRPPAPQLDATRPALPARAGSRQASDTAHVQSDGVQPQQPGEVHGPGWSAANTDRLGPTDTRQRGANQRWRYVVREL